MNITATVSDPILKLSQPKARPAVGARGADQGHDIFPLPLGHYERYMLADDTPAYPMVFTIAIDLSGTLRRGAFESALQAALLRHPILHCRIARIRGRGWCWQPFPEFAPELDWDAGQGSLDCPRGRQIDLTREIGLRIAVRHDRTIARVSFQFHHAATDGLGAMRFIGDWLGIYGQLTAATGVEIPELEPVNLELLKHRSQLWPTGDKPRRGFLARTVCRVLQFLSQMPVPLAPPSRSRGRPAGEQQLPPFVTRKLPRDVYKGLKDEAAARGATVNDLLVLDMFQTIREWNRQHGRNAEGGWYRIGVPLSLRTPLEDELPAANVLSFLFLTRRARDCDPQRDREDELLSYVHRETETVVQGEARLMFTYGAGLLLKVPGLLAGLLRVPACQATAILANVGDVRRQFHVRFPLKNGRCVAGNVTLEALLGAAPIRDKTRIAVSLGTYAGVLLVNMQCDPRFFTLSEAEQLADLFAERIRRRSRSEVLLERAA